MPTPNDNISDLVPYQPGKPIEALARERGIPAERIIKLASNENPLGMSPKASAALQDVMGELHRYPEQFGLVRALARHTGAGEDQIVLGNGSNDVLDLVARTYLGPGNEAVSSQYAFAIYQIAAQSAGATNVVVPAKDYAHDLDALLRAVTANTKVLWLANPNNPTGTFAPYADVKRFVEQVPSRVAVVLDEAYYEYLQPSERVDTTQWLAAHPNLILVRTFSKIYGLAGLRVGYGLAAPAVVELLNRVRQPINVSVAAAAAATAALKDTAFVRRSVALNQAGRQQLRAGLEELGLTCLPAYGNFVTVAVPDAAACNEALLDRGIIVRPLAGYGMPDHLRVTIGTQAENEQFLVAIREFLR
ncbi:MAG TPA: histidinol-phosphate transaminase [Candidatus Saccharimonadales bacterium]